MNKPTDSTVLVNFRGREYGAKEVRPGYALFLDAIDNQPVRNLYYYSLPAESGIMRISNSKLYRYTGSGSTWGVSLLTKTVDTTEAFTTLSGSLPYVHMSNSTDGYYIYNKPLSVGTFTVTLASPGVFTLTGHGLNTGDDIYLTTTSALPTGLTANTIY